MRLWQWRKLIAVSIPTRDPTSGEEFDVRSWGRALYQFMYDRWLSLLRRLRRWRTNGERADECYRINTQNARIRHALSAADQSGRPAELAHTCTPFCCICPSWTLVGCRLPIGGLDMESSASGENQLTPQVATFADTVSFGGVCEIVWRDRRRRDRAGVQQRHAIRSRCVHDHA